MKFGVPVKQPINTTKREYNHYVLTFGLHQFYESLSVATRRMENIASLVLDYSTRMMANDMISIVLPPVFYMPSTDIPYGIVEKQSDITNRIAHILSMKVGVGNKIENQNLTCYVHVVENPDVITFPSVIQLNNEDVIIFVAHTHNNWNIIGCIVYADVIKNSIGKNHIVDVNSLFPIHRIPLFGNTRDTIAVISGSEVALEQNLYFVIAKFGLSYRGMSFIYDEDLRVMHFSYHPYNIIPDTKYQNYNDFLHGISQVSGVFEYDHEIS